MPFDNKICDLVHKFMPKFFDILHLYRIPRLLKCYMEEKIIPCHFILRSAAKNRTLRQYDYTPNKKYPKSLIPAYSR
jgi:hypothetical protein